MKNTFTNYCFALAFALATGTALVDAQDHCTRGIAVPVINRTVYPDTTFRFGRDGRTGIETARIGSYETLLVKNHGCEYFVLTFRFVTGRYRHSTGDLAFWFRNALQRMNEIYPALETPIDIKKGLQKLRSRIETNRKGKLRKLKLGEEIVFGGDERDPNGDDIRQFLTIDKVQRLKGNRYALEISFAAGPL